MTQEEHRRRATKARHALYRQLARRHGTVRDQVSVVEAEGGAFVEVIVWIPEGDLGSAPLTDVELGYRGSGR